MNGKFSKITNIYVQQAESVKDVIFELESLYSNHEDVADAIDEYLTNTEGNRTKQLGAVNKALDARVDKRNYNGFDVAMMLDVLQGKNLVVDVSFIKVIFKDR